MTRRRLTPLVALRWIFFLAIIVAAPFVAVSLRGDDPPATDPAGSLDAELFKELEDDATETKPAPSPALKDAPDETNEPPTATEGERNEPAPSELDRELLRELSGDESENDEADPLERISGRMREVEKRLARSRPDGETQQLQEEIVAGLDEMIKEALRRAQQQSSQSSGGKADQNSQRSKVNQPQSQPSDGGDQQSQQPAQDSTERLGRDQLGRPDPTEALDLAKRLWGHLPERDRERMLNSSIEQFLPKYEMLIEQYFRRLAEEQLNRGR